MMNTATWGNAPMGGYTTVEMLLDDVSKQMAQSNAVRISRSSGSGQKIAGGSMRIVKPNSASNSPRSAAGLGTMGLGRRRTVMNDGAYRRRLAMMDQSMLVAGGYISNDGLQVPPQAQARASRPVSWHPASHLTSQQTYQISATSAPDMNHHYQLYDLPSTPSVYSGYASPDSTFSPLSLPFAGHDQYPSDLSTSYSTTHFVHQQHFVSHHSENSIPSTAMNTDSTMYSHFDWNTFATNGFEQSTTAPPTPEIFLPIQHPEPAFPPEDSIPYHPLEDNESDDGEELIGMGLYDAPDTAKSPSADPQLDNYRALMMSSLLGSSYVPRRVESTGKGLKLEETWTPPSDDEDQEDDDEQDGEGEVEEPEVKVEDHVQEGIPQQYEVAPVQRNYGDYSANQAFSHDGWL